LKKNFREIYKRSFPAIREKKEEVRKKVWSIALVIWSTIWRVAVFVLFVWGGYRLIILWYVAYPKIFPVEQIVGFIGGEIGAVACLLFIILPMNKRRKK